VEKNIPLHLPEVIFGSADQRISKQISKLKKKKGIRKIAPRLYTSNLHAPAAEIVRRNLFQILSSLYPGAMLSHRSAFEFKPTGDGQIFLTYTYTKKINLPGLTIRFLEGHKPVKGDYPVFGDLYASQQARAFLENLESSKNKGPQSKSLTLPEIEEKLELIMRTNGEEALNKLRDSARVIANELNMMHEFERLNRITGALLSTQPSKILTSKVAIARALGMPYDPNRLKLFEELFTSLQKAVFRHRPDRNTSIRSFRNFAFFESYFSNYIEGTVFEINEARKIIVSNKPLPARNDDSHDILGTYHLVSKKQEMLIVPETPEDFLKILGFRHKILLSARHDKAPGKFKDKNNYAGQTAFVDFTLVRGTLLKSFDFYRALEHPFSKAAYMMFVVSEVHPFLDGNGRIARVMMNAEFVKGGETKIIIPTVYRDDYMGALKKLTKKSDTNTYIRMLQRAQEFSENIYGDDMELMQQYLVKCNAFEEHTEAKLHIIRREG
jgi:Fic family protein